MVGTLFLSLVVSLAAPGGPESGEIGLFEAIQEALGKNPAVDEAEARIVRAEAGADEAKSAWWPTIDTDLAYTRADAPSMVLFKSIDQHGLKAGTDFNRPGTVGDFELGLGLRYSLYRGGRRVVQQRLAALRRDDATAYKQGVENELIASVIRWYFRTLEAGELVGAARTTCETVRAELRDVRTRVEGGVALKSDLLALEVRRAEAAQALIYSKNKEIMAKETLANLLGREGASTLHLSGDEWWPRPIPESAQEAVPLALESRSELQRAALGVEMGRLETEFEKGTLLPEADLSMRGYANDDDLGYRGNDVNWVLGVSVRWPVFYGGRRKARVRASSSRAVGLEASRREMALGIRLDVTEAYVYLSDARARHEVALEAVTYAEENLRLVKNQFEGGMATVTRYLDAERDLNAARVREIAARYQRNEAQANVGRSLGWCQECAREWKEEGSGVFQK